MVAVTSIVLILFASCVFLSSAQLSIPMKRMDHKFYPQPKFYGAENDVRRVGYNKYKTETGQAVGNSVIMKGGLLTLGTYYAYVTVGTPPQTFSVLIDTGSSNMGIPADNCANCGSSVVFKPAASSTFTAVSCNSTLCMRCSPDDYFKNTSKCVFGDPICRSTNKCGFGITYGGGSSGLVGTVSQDTICFGGYCVPQQNFILIDGEYPSGSFSTDPINGILGLAYPMNACNPSCTTPIFDAIVQQHNLQNFYSICLTPSSGGILDLGLIDSMKYSGKIQYTPMETRRWFNVFVEDIAVGTTSIQVPSLFYRTTNDVIGSFVDSGTTVILTAPYTFQQIQQVFQSKYGNLPGVNSTLFSGAGCVSEQVMGDQVKNFPDVVFTFRGQPGVNDDFSLPVPPQSYLMLMNGQYCLGIGSAIGVGLVLGDVFMENYYVVFDRQNDRLGFAPIVNCN